ncbi:hypothetical protein [Microbulbifer halophilus]|uniref:Uncharacterized protein n=1 Tax=Microbulbifer halophilus TaxID=453963 RepID=A0ABW5EAJ9_9GAMM|nr:hypothetical protein [Microbulbifer halophilus]MCW8126409.1 hypothetical protein [Microbulbifer halophilus]
MIVSFFKRIPPAISVPGFYIFSLVIYLLRFLLGTAFGALILSILLYQYFQCCSQITPFSVEGLFDWFAQLDAEYKVALFTASVTVTGFVVAFHTATANWRNQMLAELKMQAAGAPTMRIWSHSSIA